MSIQSEIDRINQNVANTYSALEGLGADMPTEQNSTNLARTVESVKAVLYSAQTLTDEQKAQARANIGAVSKTGLYLGRHEDGLLYLYIDGVPVGDGVDLPAGGIDGYITPDKQIVFNNLPDGEYTLAYINDDGSVVPIGAMEKDTNVYYTVTNTLTQCTSNNSATKVVQGGSYSATITAKSGYELESVAVTMGGSPVSVNGGVINIANVTGNIVITAVATEIQTSGYTNLAKPNDPYWKEGYRLSISGGGTSELTGHTTTNFIPAKADDILRVKGMTLVGTSGGGTGYKIVAYSTKDSESSNVGGLYGVNTANKDSYGLKVSTSGDVSTYKILYNNTDVQSTCASQCAYIRIDGALMTGYTKNDVIITINEEITD